MEDVENLTKTGDGQTQLRGEPGIGDAWAMVEASPDGMILLDEHGVILMVNSQIEAIFGYPRSEVLGTKVEALIPERYRQVHTAHRTRYRATPKSRAMGEDLDLMACRKDGSEFPVEVSLSPVTVDGDLRVVATVRDITHRMEVQAHSHAVLHTIDSAHDGVFMFTADTLQFEYVNQGAASQLGYSREELLGMSPLHIKPEYTDTTFRELIEPLLAGQLESLVFTTTHRRKDGSDVSVEIILEYPPGGGAGQHRMLVALVRDVGERLEAERALRISEAAVRMLEDRERLAFDLHDLVIQRLFAAGMALQAVQTVVHNPEVESRIKDTVSELDQAITELRSTIFNLTTPDQRTAADTISEILSRAEQVLGFSPSLRFKGDPETISGAILDQLLPVLTESLANVAQHAEATSCDVVVSANGGPVELAVTDDGVGLSDAAPRGHGLNNMASRARRVGGSVAFAAGPDGGTVLTWTAGG